MAGIQPRKKNVKTTSFKKGNTVSQGRRSKGKNTLLREAIVANAETLILKDFTKIVKKTVEMAASGDTRCIKIIWDRYMPAKDFDKTDTEKLNISITIEGMKTVDVVEGEFKEVN